MTSLNEPYFCVHIGSNIFPLTQAAQYIKDAMESLEEDDEDDEDMA